MSSSFPKITFRSLLLLESEFWRKPVVKIDGTEVFEASLEVNAGELQGENAIFSELTVIARLRYKEDVQASARVKMAGAFVPKNASEAEKKQFGFINAPAIIFPFIREHISSLFTKAVLPGYLLDPVNFVELAEKHMASTEEAHVQE